jgi:rhamnosyltransferase
LCNKAIADNFKYFLFFDQDTIFTTDTLNYIQNFIRYKENCSIKFFDSVLSVNFREKSIESTSLNIISKDKIDVYEIITIFFNINSGTLFLLEKYKCFQWFDKKYFVDGVDYAFSLNVVINNFKNVSISNVPGLNHTEEQGDRTIKILGKKIASRVYPISRNIDFLRSHIMLLLKSFNVKYAKPKLFIIKDTI